MGDAVWTGRRSDNSESDRLVAAAYITMVCPSSSPSRFIFL